MAADWIEMLSIEEIARRIRAIGDGAVEGLDEAGVRQVREAWGVARLPDEYVRFLRRMGVSAGRLLRGTDAFFPEILQLPGRVAEFLEENAGGMPMPGGALVFAMHQGYQVYWLKDASVPDPGVALYMEAGSGPLEVWPSFADFLNAEFERSYGRV